MFGCTLTGEYRLARGSSASAKRRCGELRRTGSGMRSGEWGRSAGPKDRQVGLAPFHSSHAAPGLLRAVLRAQGNYEVQVYGSDLVAPNVTMVELHSNFTASGTKGVIDGVLPTNHASTRP